MTLTSFFDIKTRLNQGDLLKPLNSVCGKITHGWGNYSFNGCRNGFICGIPIYYFGCLEFFHFIEQNFNELDSTSIYHIHSSPYENTTLLYLPQTSEQLLAFIGVLF